MGSDGGGHSASMHETAAAEAVVLPRKNAADKVYDCARCGHVFTKQSNLDRHLARKHPCARRKGHQLTIDDYAMIVCHGSTPLMEEETCPAEYVHLLWKMCESVHVLDSTRGYDVMYQFLVMLHPTHIRTVLKKKHHGTVKKTLLHVYSHLRKLRESGQATVHGRCIQDILDQYAACFAIVSQG